MGKKGKTRLKLHEIDMSNDMSYRGPLSYREFRIFGWLCIALSQVVVLMSLGQKISPESAASMNSVINILSIISSLSLPFLLLANFSLILNCHDSYKKQMIKNGAISGAIIILFLLFYYRYIRHAVMAFTAMSAAEADELFRSMFPTGFVAFNLFIDLFLCTLVMFFLNYHPKKIFTGKKVIIFRLFTILPIAYEVASISLKAAAIFGGLQVPVILSPFFTVKPPVTFFVFLILAAYIKTKEYRYCKNGRRTYEEYRVFLQTNKNSFQFSRFAAIVLVIAGIVDLVILLIVTNHTVWVIGVQEATEATAEIMLVPAQALGFGEAISLIPLAPLMMLFSYTRTRKGFLIDLLIPLLGVVLIIFIYLEGFHYGASGIAEMMQGMFAG